MGILNTMRPTMAGTATKRTSLSEKEMVSRNSSILPSETNCEKLGRAAVPKAMTKIPRGNSIKRYEK